MRRAPWVLAAALAASTAWPAAAQIASALHPSVFFIPLVPEAVDTPLFTTELWDALRPVDAPMAAWLRARIPGVDASQVHEMTADQADHVLSEAVARGYSGSDLFSDRGLRTSRMYLARQADVELIFNRYEMRVLTLPSGQTLQGQPYRLQALLLGNGRVVCLYDVPEFELRNPYFPKRKFRFHDPIVYTILGPADLGMKGIEVNWNLVWPDINRFVKIGPNTVRVETSLGAAEEDLQPISRRR